MKTNCIESSSRLTVVDCPVIQSFRRQADSKHNESQKNRDLFAAAHSILNPTHLDFQILSIICPRPYQLCTLVNAEDLHFSEQNTRDADKLSLWVCECKEVNLLLLLGQYNT